MIIRVDVPDRPDWKMLIPEEDLACTPKEPFTVEPPSDEHPYNAALEFVVSRLGPGGGRQCLAVGSPPFEVRALKSAGWDTTLVDIRQPPDQGLRWVQADASRLPFRSSAFDSLSSTCCYCHVGMGRYNDPRYPDGDRRGLSEAVRVLKPGARAAIMLGPSIPTAQETWDLGIVHRIYNLAGAVERIEKAGFKTLEVGFWHAEKKVWLSPAEVEDCYGAYGMGESMPYCYLCFHLEKP